MSNNITIGIDPDIEKSGYAVFHGEKLVSFDTYYFFDLIERLKRTSIIAKSRGKNLTVVIEKGEDNTAIFSAYKAKTKQIAAKIGVSVGKNFAVTDILIQYCIREKIDFKTFTPLKENKKWNSKQVSLFFGVKRSNQEERDAMRAGFAFAR